MTYLANWLNDKKIQYVESVDSWEESIQIAGEPLLQDGSICQQYIDAIIRQKKEIGPYFVIAPQIAMPHARPEQGAISLGLSIVVVGNPVIFGSEENDPVKVIFMFSASDNHCHLEMISQLSEVLSDNKIMSQILSVRSSEELKSILLTETTNSK